ncbi:MAG: lipoprotein insertase outer membrane protein LolB [Gammaproteobacteria bacterium]|nr:lipoprotein insertase outer membrane protein LolB [Gammaproteobacteria bacterium]
MKLILFLLLAISVAGCSTTPPHKSVADPDKKWEQRKTVLSGINHWVINGRLALINGDESWHMNLKWQRHGDMYVLDLSGPFGTGHTQLTGSKGNVLLVDAEQNYFYADSPDRLLQEVTGLQIPVKSLLYWINGIPDWNVKVDNQRLDAFGRLAELRQSDWNIRYKKYIYVKEHELPQKIFIDGFNLKVKIFIDEWELKDNVTSKDNLTKSGKDV